MVTKQQLAQYCADHFPSQIIHSGVTYMHTVIAAFVALAAGFGIGWYVKARGLAGVKTDASTVATTVKTDAQAVSAAL